MIKIKELINKTSFIEEQSSNEPNPPYSTRYAINQIQKYESVLNQNNRSLIDFPKILEFGCGHGRLIKYFFDINPSSSIYGSDVLEKQIEKCKQDFPKGNFIQNGTVPPIDFQDNAFDFIYSYSVFTHLAENNHIAWLNELGRILKPGGLMLHSVKSYEFVRRAKIFSPDNLLNYGLNEPYEKFEINNPYHYIVDNPKTPEYGITIISKKYILDNWEKSTQLKILSYNEGCIETYPEGCHDLILLRKP
ncbi:MAG: hypothetical protein CMG75_07605 [Candidatus Marinimicrobia bacterium]|nr:hypothetical protein [Candidatus Neomarinimicrobiota bacterium]|tara:strand:+ start:10349 stop:11092 length:744 start_codon:yes stop_codon:yes gene_type:complete